MILSLNTPVSQVYMIGPVYASRLKKLGIETIEDLLNHYPSRYEDYRQISKISLVQPGETITIVGKIIEIKNVFTKNHKRIQRAVVSDETGEMEVIWYNQTFLTNVIKKDLIISISGKADWFGHKVVMNSPDYEIINQPFNHSAIGPFNSVHTGRHTGRLVPIYPETYGVSSKWIRSRIYSLFKQFKGKIPEYLPDEIINENGLVNISDAVYNIHFPNNLESAESARKRLAFDEFFLIQLSSQLRKKEWKKESVKFKVQSSKFQKEIQDFISKLPFTLTTSQEVAIREIFNDLSKNQPMNRMLEGDVGSGKTVVAAIAMYLTYLNGFQSVLMAPTGILAEQHFKTINNLLSPLGVHVSLVTSSSKSKVLGSKSENNHIFIGTQALLNDKLKMKKLGLVVIDEQQRFGVEQRAILKDKGKSPHLLTMTATPIPRTVALTIYGELDLSVLSDMPKGRKEIKTWVVPEEKRAGAYRWIEDRVIKEKEQIFIICPLVEESESETMAAVKAVKVEYDRLKNEIFPTLSLGLLHGRMKTKEKNEVLDQFRSGKTTILVATPVVEVGIDIPNATVMMIEGAERFGLAGLHQLRGRVGRGDKQSYCLLFTQKSQPEIVNRLKYLEKIHDGPTLAEADLKLRGPGEVYGVRQHGVPNLKIASYADTENIMKSKSSALKFVNGTFELPQFPLLHEKLNSLTIKNISRD